MRLATADGRPLRLSYCTNVHPAETLDDIVAVLRRDVARVRDAVARPGEPFGVGLWLPARAAAEAARDPARAAALRRALDDLSLFCVSLNVFPYGDFHGERVKEAVYRPTWLEPERLAYTLDAARVLAALLPAGEREGTMSTLPGGLPPAPGDATEADAFAAGVAAGLAHAAAGLGAIEAETGRAIRLLVEPEPGCFLETTARTLDFFAGPLRAAAGDDLIARHLGVCFDASHLACRHERLGESLHALAAARVPVGKLHVSCALEGPLAAFRPFAEPRYCHQVVAPDGRFAMDLEAVFADPRFEPEDRVRVHFHAPVFADSLAPGLRTTRPDLEDALAAAVALDPPPHLEVETYTLSVIPPAELARLGVSDTAAALARELRWTLDRLAALG